MNTSFSKNLIINEETVPIISQLTESIPGGFFIYHADGDQELIYFNSHLVTLFGCDSAEDFKTLTGNSFKGIVYPDDYRDTEKSIWEQIASNEEKIDHVKYRILRKDGSVGVLDDYGHFAQTRAFGDIFYVFVQDISEQVRKDSDYQKVVEVLAEDFDLVCLIDVETNKDEIFKLTPLDTELYPEWEGIANFTERLDFIKNNAVHPDDRLMFHEATRKQVIMDEVRKNGSYSVSYRTRSRGSIAYWRAQFKLVDWGRLQLVAGFINITAEVQKEHAEKAELEKQLSIIKGLSEEYTNVCFVDLARGTLENIAVGDVIKNDVGRLLKEKVNVLEAYYAFVNTLVHPEDRDRMRPILRADYINRTLAEQKQYRLEYRRLFGSEYKWCEVVLVKAEETDAKPLHVAVGFAEIDERYKARQAREQIRKEYEDELIEARDRAEAANEAKTRFLFNMSHDIRTPMNAILGFTDIAKKNLDSKEKVADCIEKIDRSGQHLLGLINDVLEMSRIEAGKVELNEEAVDVRKHRGTLVAMLQNQAAEKNITLTFENRNIKHTFLTVDSLRMDEILINIISNAIKYTPEGGHVSCVVEHREAEKPGYVRVHYTISDDGIGMSKEFVQKIFDPFTRAESSTVSGVPGTGLGMSIVKRLLNMMGGTIEVQSEPRKGTTVIMDTDLRIAERVEQDTTEEKAVDFAGRRVLLVEDNELNREIAESILEDSAFIVDTAEDGDIAVDAIKEKGAGYYDIVLMDIQMPRMNGYEATKEIRRLPDGEKLPIIALSANAFEEDRRKSREAGMDDHVAKPIDVKELKETLAKFL